MKTENRADLQRKEKERRVEAANMEVRERLAKSAETWRKSREGVRLAAKGAQDSSEVKDNVFSDFGDRSEPIVYNQKMSPEDSKSYGNPCQTSTISDPSLRPISQYANCSNPFYQFLQQRIESSHNIDPNLYHQLGDSYNNFRNNRKFETPNINVYQDQMSQHLKPMQYNNYNGTGLQNRNWNHLNNNTYNCGESTQNVFKHTPFRPNNANHISLAPRNIQNQNYPFNNYLHPQYIERTNQYIYNPNDMMTHFTRSSNQFANEGPRFPGFYRPDMPFNPYPSRYRRNRGETSSIESMKKCMTSLLDRLELLNETVARIKNENVDHRCSRSVMDHNQNHYYTNTQPSNIHQTSCECRCYRRPLSSASQYNNMHSASCNQYNNRTHNQASYRMHSSCNNINMRASHKDCQNSHPASRSCQNYPSNNNIYKEINKEQTYFNQENNMKPMTMNSERSLYRNLQYYPPNTQYQKEINKEHMYLNHENNMKYLTVTSSEARSRNNVSQLYESVMVPHVDKNVTSNVQPFYNKGVGLVYPSEPYSINM